MKLLRPPGYRYAVVQLDPVGMVKHFRDPIATAEAREMRPKKYLVYLDTVSTFILFVTRHLSAAML